MKARLNVAVLASGRGSNLEALLKACAAEDFPAKIGLVICNVPGAGAIDKATHYGVPSQIIDHKAFPDRASFDGAIDAALRAAGIKLVCLAGFMRLLTAGFTQSWQGRLINIHPSLLPAFKGLSTHRRALEAGIKLHGCTVHFVTPELDDGPIIAQAAVPVIESDDESSLAERVLTAEHQLYPLALRLIGEGRVSIDGTIVRVSGPADSKSMLISAA